MPPKSSNANSAYKSKLKLDLEKLKNGQIQRVKVDLTKVNIRTFATQVGVLSEYVKLYMKLLTSKRHYALNDRTINLLRPISIIRFSKNKIWGLGSGEKKSRIVVNYVF